MAHLLQVEHGGGDPLDAVHHPVGIRRSVAPHGDVLVEVELPPDGRVLRLEGGGSHRGWGWGRGGDLDADLDTVHSPFLEGAGSGGCDLSPRRLCLSVAGKTKKSPKSPVKHSHVFVCRLSLNHSSHSTKQVTSGVSPAGSGSWPAR